MAGASPPPRRSSSTGSRKQCLHKGPSAHRSGRTATATKAAVVLRASSRSRGSRYSAVAGHRLLAPDDAPRKLEQNTQTELNISRTRAAEDLAELRRVHSNARSIPETQGRSVEHIVKLRPELCGDALADALIAE